MARAVGFIEAEGFVPIFDAVDAMVKATEVDVRGVTRLGGGIVAVAVAGDLATVEEAVEIGEEVARAISGRAVKSIVFASPCAPVGALADDLALVGIVTAHAGGNAIGIIETRGVVALTAGIEAMMKTADVQTIAVERISSGYLAAAVRGSLAAGAAGAWRPGRGRASSTASCAPRRCTRKPHEHVRRAARQRHRRIGCARRHRGGPVILGEVLGRVWADRQHTGLDGRRLVLVRDLASDARHVAVDLLDAGTGTTVLVATDEAAAAATDLPGWTPPSSRWSAAGTEPPHDGESPFPGTASRASQHAEMAFSPCRKRRLAVLERETRPGAAGAA